MRYQISPLRPAPIDIRFSLNVDLQRMIAGEEQLVRDSGRNDRD